MKIYNSLTRKKEEIKLRPKQKELGIYLCGPTVYDFAHIGNFRTYASADFLIRALHYFGFKTKVVENITDIDDKTIAAAKEAGIGLPEYTKKYESIYFNDLNVLNILPADIYCRATEHFTEMKALVQKLLEKKIAYERDGSIYFSIAKWKKYGQLEKNAKSKMQNAKSRIDADNYDKENIADFALWKRDEDFKEGRPGWHLECSAMSMKYLGETIDIHAGGIDLLFPHHENEIAQSEAATGKDFVRYWFHVEHLLVDGQKMAKSAGNFYTLEDVLNKDFSGRDLRYFYLNSHYREKENFTWEGLESAQKTLENIDRIVLEKRKAMDDKGKQRVTREIERAVADDLNMPKALALLHEANDYRLWLKFDAILGLGLDKIKAKKLTAKQEELFKKREELRKAGEFKEADEVREELVRQGVEIKDEKVDKS